jgi:hypothetical protein
MTTSKAVGDSESLARAMQRSREFLVEQHELQQLPTSAMIITYAGPAGRQVVMADTNPGIGGLGATTALTLEEYRRLSAPDVTARKPAAREPAAREPAAGGDGGPRPVSWRRDRPPPNLGPPPQRLDWRRRGS